MAGPRLQQLEQALVNAHAAGDQDGARILAQEVIKKRRSLGMQDDGTYVVPNAADTGGTLQLGPFDTGISLGGGTTRFLAGVGKGFTDVARGLGQAAGVVSRDDVAESRRLDEQLMNTTGGKWGAVVGTGAALAPTAFFPGANTYAGAVGIGTLAGALAPSVSTEETLKNTGLGGVAGVGGQLAGRVIGAGYQGVKALAAPFFEKGQERIAARTLQAYASDPNAAAATLRNVRPSPIAGSQPTVAEVAVDPGLAQLQRTIANNPEAGRILAQRLMENQQARADALRSMAGDTARREAAFSAREAASSDLYNQATKASYTIDDELAGLLSRPAVKAAMARAKTVAENQGRPFTFAVEGAAPFAGVGGSQSRATQQITGQGLQDLKMAMDELLTDPASGFAGKAGDAVKNLRGQLVSWMEKANPEFKAAREAYSDASKPLNQMDVAQELLRKLTPESGAIGERGAMYARALASGDDLARSATGFKGARLADTMTPDQMATLLAIRDQIAGVANMNNLGRAAGSNTAQNTVSQNFLRQTLGPMGAPQSWAESTLLESLLRPVQFAAKAGEQRITPRLADALMDPQEAARLLQLAQQRGLLERAGARSLNALAPAGAAYALPAER